MPTKHDVRIVQRVEGRLMLNDSAYSFVKKLVQIYIPAFAALYFGLGKIWGFPEIEQICGSCAVVATFLGVCLGISSNSYEKSGAGYDGDITVNESEKTGKKTYSLNLKGDPKEIDQKETVTFRIPKD